MFQFAAVKVSTVVLSIPSVESPLVRETVTLAVGALFRTTVKFAVVPFSSVVRFAGITVIPATSSSIFVKLTSSMMILS